MENGILLESGTNELEILEFKVGQNFYGINVAKIREILPFQRTTPIPNSHPSIEGILMPRDSILCVIDLSKTLNLPRTGEENKDMLIVTNFNQLNIAFHVHEVVGIHRVSWADISKPDATISTAANGIATGIIKIDSKLIIILDFEKIVSEISPETGLKVSDVDKFTKRGRNNSPILMVEDSPLLSKLIYDSLYKAGYNNIIITSNGVEAWDKLQEIKGEGSIEKDLKCIITDIEMPQMDGHHLTKLVKSDSVLAQIPVVIFSSLVNEDMKRKGEALGADAQLSKPEIGQLVDIIDNLLWK